MKFSDTGSFTAFDKRKREPTSVRTRDFLKPRIIFGHTVIPSRNLSPSKLKVPTHEGDRAQCAAHIVYGVYSTVLSQHYHAENASISLVKMGKQEYVLMPRHGEACDRQQSQCSDYVLMTSNKQITVFEFLMFMRLNNCFTCFRGC